jgi:hypothetical protein
VVVPFVQGDGRDGSDDRDTEDASNAALQQTGVELAVDGRG